LLGVELEGSTVLFVLGTATFLFAMTALGITLATIAKSMPQFGLLTIPFFVVMNLLSGGVTPLEAMPQALQMVMQAAPSTHFTAFAQSVLFRGAGIGIVWPMLLTMAGIGAVLFAIALVRFRATMSAAR
jgi:ABC-2 type transport system permease protein